MTPRRRLALHLLNHHSRDGWVTPRMIGATSNSWHARELRRLARLGYAMQRRKGPRSFEYLITSRGKAALKGEPNRA